jgi:hypothetical protein
MGNELFKQVVGATGLPSEIMTKELSEVLEGKGFASENVTLDELRLVLADYLREVILHAKDKFEDGICVEEEIDPEDLGKEEA